MLTQQQTLAFEPPDYYAQTLLPQHIPALMDLQQAVKESSLEKPYHMKPWTKGDIEDHLKAGMPIVGIFDSHYQLVAATILSDPNNPEAKKIGEYPLHYPDEIIIKAFCVHPDHAGKGLAKMLDREARDIYPDATFVAKVAIDNYKSLDSFINRGYSFNQERTTSIFTDEFGYEHAYQAVFFVKAPQPAETLVLMHGNTQDGGFQPSAPV